LFLFVSETWEHLLWHRSTVRMLFRPQSPEFCLKIVMLNLATQSLQQKIAHMRQIWILEWLQK
jgi:hypothetical protein